jgi:hypothetical protein
MWNSFGPPANFAAKNVILDEWCAKVGTDPAWIERTVALQPDEIGDWQAYLDAGATHMIVMVGAPYDLGPVEELFAHSR